MPIKEAKVTVCVPSSTANLGPGFDVFALALAHLNDLVTVETLPNKTIQLQVSGLNADSIPLEPDKNTAGLVAKSCIQIPHGFTAHFLRVNFNRPLKRGKATKKIKLREILGIKSIPPVFFNPPRTTS